MKQQTSAIVVWMVIVSLLCFCQSGFAAPTHFFVDAKELEKAGIDYTNFFPINLAHNGSYFVGSIRVTDLRSRVDGVCWKLGVVKFSGQKFAGVDIISLPVIHWVNGVVSDQRDEVCVLAEHGTKILQVDLAKQKVRTIWEHQEGKPGFKAGPFLGCHRGYYFGSGWFYNNEKFWKGDYLAKFYIRRKKTDADKPLFKTRKMIDLDWLYNRAVPGGFSKSHFYVSPGQIYFNVVKPAERKTHLFVYKDGKITPIDKGYMLNLFIGTPDRVYYRVIPEEKKKVAQHMVYDLKTGKRWKVAKDGAQFTYPFFTDDSQRLILVEVDRKYSKNTMSAYSGQAKHNYKLYKFIHRQPIGPMKVSYDGKHYLLMLRNGLLVGGF